MVLNVVVFLGSFLMHLSETKHGLPGAFGLGRYSYEFFCIDRLMSFIGIFVMFLHYTRIDWLAIAIVGGICLRISECRGVTISTFVLYHSLWHVSVYYILYQATIDA